MPWSDFWFGTLFLPVNAFEPCAFVNGLELAVRLVTLGCGFAVRIFNRARFFTAPLRALSPFGLLTAVSASSFASDMKGDRLFHQSA